MMRGADCLGLRLRLHWQNEMRSMYLIGLPPDVKHDTLRGELSVYATTVCQKHHIHSLAQIVQAATENQDVLPLSHLEALATLYTISPVMRRALYESSTRTEYATLLHDPTTNVCSMLNCDIDCGIRNILPS